jgi:predicted transcriptional regulator
LGELEDAVMTRVWQWNRPVTVREVLEDLQQNRSIAYTTVMTVMDNLHQKGWVRREVEGRAYRYTAVSTRAAYSAALMNEAWAQSDNPAAALVAFFGMMSPEQQEALRAAVRIVRADVPEDDAASATGPTGADTAAHGESRADNAAETEPGGTPGTVRDEAGEGADKRSGTAPDGAAAAPGTAAAEPREPAGKRGTAPADPPGGALPAAGPAEHPEHQGR